MVSDPAGTAVDFHQRRRDHCGNPGLEVCRRTVRDRSLDQSGSTGRKQERVFDRSEAGAGIGYGLDLSANDIRLLGCPSLNAPVALNDLTAYHMSMLMSVFRSRRSNKCPSIFLLRGRLPPVKSAKVSKALVPASSTGDSSLLCLRQRMLLLIASCAALKSSLKLTDLIVKSGHICYESAFPAEVIRCLSRAKH